MEVNKIKLKVTSFGQYVLMRLLVKNPGSVNFMIAVDKTAKMLALIPQVT